MGTNLTKSSSSVRCFRTSKAAIMEPLEARTLCTVLIFQPGTGAYPDYSVLSQNYGDRVNAAVQGGFKYGTAGGPTPNVLASYGSTGSTAETWQGGYGILPNVIFASPNGAKFHMALTADPNYSVKLSSFDMASYSSADYVINSVQIIDLKSNKVLFTESNVKIFGGTSPHVTHFVFPTPLQSSSLAINFDSSNSGGYNVGIDNIQFSQTSLPKTIVSGMVFNDANGNGKLDAGEKGLSLWRVFIDANNNGIYDPGEQYVTTSSTGAFSFTLTTPGTYVIGVELYRGYYQTAPHALVVTATVPGASITNANFGVKLITPP